ncbi:MAG: glycosyltransferase family 2 protein [Pyrinomonadaceae bacterium]|nr:glycosyltransferase family 2 protein [Pyrinomonadaceae bacterium]
MKINEVKFEKQSFRNNKNQSIYQFTAAVKFAPESFPTGTNLLKIKVYNSLGNKKVFSRSIIIGKENTLDLIKRYGKKVFSIPSGEITFSKFQKENQRRISQIEPSSKELTLQRKQSCKFNYKPLISIITNIYKETWKGFKKTFKSLINQSYKNWELALVADYSIKSEIVKILQNYSAKDSQITAVFLDTKVDKFQYLNECSKLTKGDFISIVNSGDQLAPNALFENVSLLNQQSNADFIYSDENILSLNDNRCQPHFKPDWSPDYFYSTMYTGNLGLYRRSLVNKIGGFRPEFREEQQIDLVLRLIEQTQNIFHIPKILFHQNKIGTENWVLRKQLLSKHLEKIGLKAKVIKGLTDDTLRVKRTIPNAPKATIIIPTCNKVELLENCINSIKTKTNYKNYEIIIVDNNSSESSTLDYLSQVSVKQDIKVLHYSKPFNFSAINNFAANHAKGELLLFLNNDTEVISNEWLDSMIEHAIRSEVGAVGARLLYFNDTVQHAGIITGISQIAGHSHKYYSSNHSGYFNRAKTIQNVSAVTGACLMVKAETFKSLKGFDEKNLPVAFNDIDLCLRIRQKNLLIVYTPFAELYHYESASRGSDQTLKNNPRFQKELNYMLEKWGKILAKDPYYNPNLTLEREDFSMENFRRS